MIVGQVQSQISRVFNCVFKRMNFTPLHFLSRQESIPPADREVIKSAL